MKTFYRIILFSLLVFTISCSSSQNTVRYIITDDSFIRFRLDTKFKYILNAEGPADFIQYNPRTKKPERYWYYNKDIDGYSVDISYTNLGEKCIIHYFLVINENNEIDYEKIFYELSEKFNYTYNELNYKIIEYRTYIMHQKLWKVRDNPMEFIKLDLDLPQKGFSPTKNDIGNDFYIVITHSPYAL